MAEANGKIVEADISSEKAYDWFLQIADGGFDYIATMTRRSPNWLECARLKYDANRPKFARLTTENGLLMLAEDLAYEYISSGVFPRIALFDDVLVHGRSLNAFLKLLQDLLTEVLCGQITFESEQLWNDLSSSITLFICYANSSPFLLRHEFQWSMRLQYVAREREWREFSAGISDLIWKSDVANTSYVISAVQQTADAPAAVGNWEFVGEEEIPYRGAQQRLYVHPLSHDRWAFPTVRSYVCEGKRYYTPYFFCGVLDEAQIQAVYDCIQPVLSQSQSFMNLLNRAARFPSRQAVYFQLINLLIGQIILQLFFRDVGLNSAEFSYDTEKIASNFGLAADVGPIFDKLCHIAWPENFLELLVSQMGIACVEKRESLETVPASRLRAKMEQIVYSRAVQHEAYAKHLERSFVTGFEAVPIRRTGEVSFEGFLVITLDEFNLSKYDYRSTLLVLACLTQMMDRGDVSLKARVEPGKQGALQYYSAVRNTEMSLSIMPRKLMDYFDDFYRLTHFFWKDKNFPIQARSYFHRIVNNADPNTEEIVDTAGEYAEIISRHPDLINCLMDWKGVPLNVEGTNI